MNIPNRLQQSTQQDKLEEILARTKRRKQFRTGGREYNLLIQKPHGFFSKNSVSREYPHFIDQPGEGLIRRDSHWERVSPLRKLAFYSRMEEDFIPDNHLAIEDLESEEDFKKWFEQKYGDLPDGVYTAMQRLGKGRGFQHLFVLRMEMGEVVEWKKKSNGTPRQNASSYFTLPFYFWQRDRWKV